MIYDIGKSLVEELGYTYTIAYLRPRSQSIVVPKLVVTVERMFSRLSTVRTLVPTAPTPPEPLSHQDRPLDNLGHGQL